MNRSQAVDAALALAASLQRKCHQITTSGRRAAILPIIGGILALCPLGAPAQGQQVVNDRVTLSGSTLVKSESRPVEEFTEIDLVGSGTLIVRQSDKQALTVRAEDNLLPALQSRVDRGTLHLDVRPNTNLVPTKPIEYLIEVKRLDHLTLVGNAVAKVTSLDGRRCVLTLCGDCAASLSGHVDSLTSRLAGHCKLDADGLRARQTEVSATGASKARVNASQYLDVHLSGHGSVEYSGDPQVKKSISGSGRIEKIHADVGRGCGPGNRALAQATDPSLQPARVVQSLSQRIAGLLAANPDPIQARMLRCVEALVQTELASTAPYHDSKPELAASVAGYAATILAGLNSAAADWAEYTDGRRAITLAFRGRDGSLQPYQVRLPANWQPEQSYPIIVFLHGITEPDPLNFVARMFAPEPMPQRPADAPERAAIQLYPWARGNLQYQGLAEDDIEDAARDAMTWLRLEMNRIYLFGHSMGGAASWAMALRRPSIFAAVAIQSGGTWLAPVGVGLGVNAAHLPIRIHHGDRDEVVPVTEAYKMAKELRLYGNTPTLDIVPGAEHEYTEEATRSAYAWLLRHKRTRPDRFAFIADTSDHVYDWGIEIFRDPAISSTPRLDCEIKDNVVRLRSRGTHRLKVNPGANGLELSGNITLFWNERRLYSGPVRPLDIDTVKGSVTAH